MPIVNLKVLTNNGSGTYLDLDVSASSGEMPIVTSTGLSNLYQDALNSVGEGATYDDTTRVLTLPITILGFATTANKTTADYSVGDTITLAIGSQTIYAVPATSRLSVDVSTLAGWANLSAGSHDITIVAKASGFKDSAPSAAVQVTKAASTKTLKAGTYKWKDVPDVSMFTYPYGVYSKFNFVSNGETFTNLYVTNDDPTDCDIRYTPKPNGMHSVGGVVTQNGFIGGGYDEDYSWVDVPAYQTITLATDQQVSADFYEWAITGGNLVQQTAYIETGTYKWADYPFHADDEYYQAINFASNGSTYKAINMHYDSSNMWLRYGEEVGFLKGTVVCTTMDSPIWTDTVYQVIDIASSQEVSYDFYKFAIIDGYLTQE